MKETKLSWLDISFDDSVTCKNMAEFVAKYRDLPTVSVKNIYGYVCGRSNGAHSKYFQTWCIFDPACKKQMSNDTLSLKTYRKNPEVTSSDDEENKNKIPELKTSKRGLTNFDMKNVKCLIAIIGMPEKGEEYKAKDKICKLIPYVEF